jgi:hypothetical protein
LQQGIDEALEGLEPLLKFGVLLLELRDLGILLLHHLVQFLNPGQGHAVGVQRGDVALILAKPEST